MTTREAGSSPSSGRPSMRSTETTIRETWLCRSTVGAMSDGEEDLRSETSDEQDNEQVEVAKPSVVYDDEGNAHERHMRVKKTEDACALEKKSSRTRSRKLTLGSHLDLARGHALRKVIPPMPVTPVATVLVSSTPHAAIDKKRQRKFFPALEAKQPVDKTTDDEMMKKEKKVEKKRGSEGDRHMAIYMDYERDTEIGKSPKQRVVFVVRHVWTVHAALFMSTACVHCVSFNTSPALRRLFQIETLPVGLCIVVAWTILGLVNCLGAWVGTRGDRIELLRRLSWLWIVAIVLLQLAKVLPVASWFTNSLLCVGYVAAVTAHGLAVPNAIAVGAEIVSTQAMAISTHDDDSKRRQQESVDATMTDFITWGFGVMLAASSLVQAFYFAAVDLELAPAEHFLVLRSRRAICITILVGVLLLALIVIFLFQSRHHYVPPSITTTEADSRSSSVHQPESSTTQARNSLERKLARGEFDSFSIPDEASTSRSPDTKCSGLREWFQLVRRSFVLTMMGIFTLVLVVTVIAVLVTQTVADKSSSASAVMHLVLFAVLSLGWAITMLLGTSQLAPSSRDKLYGHMDDLMVVPLLPSRQQLFVLVALICLASAAALAAFVRAQLYATLFVQTCQLRRPHAAAVLYDPNVIGAWVGLVSVLLLPCVHCAVRRCTSKFKSKSHASRSPPRVSAARRVAIGVLLYLIAIFMSSVVELYRRASRWPSSNSIVSNPAVSGCVKTQASNFTVLWSVPHLIVFSLADAVFRVGAAEEAHMLTAPLGWLSVAQGVLSLADSVGYGSALALTKTLSPWLYRVKTSDLVLLLLLITAIASLAYALTKRLVDHIHASRRTFPDPSYTRGDMETIGPASPCNAAADSESDPAGRKEALRIAQFERPDNVEMLPSVSSSRLRQGSLRTLKIEQQTQR